MTNESQADFVTPTGGYGRIWESTYKGSMVGSGPEVFCVWPYVIANMRRNAQHGVCVDLNPRLLAAIFGAEPSFVTDGIKKLCEPDPESHSKAEDGRRLVHISGHLYRVVNGPAHIEIRSKVEHAEAQSRYLKKKKKQGSTATTVASQAPAPVPEVQGPPKPKLTAREMINRAVAADPLTIQDAAELERIRAGLPPGSAVNGPAAGEEGWEPA